MFRDFPERKKEEIYITISPRLYSKEEADQCFAELQSKMESLILSEEDSFDAISGNLQLKKIFYPENIKATWSFRPESLWIDQEEHSLQDNDENYANYRDILEDSGLIHHEYLEKNRILSGTLEVVLSANIHPDKEVEGEEISSFFNNNNEITYNSPTYSYYLRILPLNLSESEAVEMALQNTLQYSNEHTRSEEKLVLPKEILGHPLHFSEKKNFRYLLIPLLGLFACFLLPLQALEQEKTKQKARISSLTLDYAELVSKLVVYLGAGLAIRNSFLEIAKHYNYLVKNCAQESHPLYEELNTLLNQLGSNVGEGEAYLNFSQRIALRPYSKLISLIEQNRKNGSKDLSRQLHMEMDGCLFRCERTGQAFRRRSRNQAASPLNSTALCHHADDFVSRHAVPTLKQRRREFLENSKHSLCPYIHSAIMPHTKGGYDVQICIGRCSLCAGRLDFLQIRTVQEKTKRSLKRK